MSQVSWSLNLKHSEIISRFKSFKSKTSYNPRKSRTYTLNDAALNIKHKEIISWFSFKSETSNSTYFFQVECFELRDLKFQT